MKSARYDFILTLPEDSLIRRLRWRRRFIVASVLLALLLAGLSIRPAIHTLRRWHARRLCAEADVFLQREEWQKAVNDIRQAATLQPGSSEVMRRQARLLSATGNFLPAEGLWKQLVELGEKLTPNDRRDYAACTIANGNLAAADKLITSLRGDGYHTAADQVLEARLAEHRADRSSATSLALGALSAQDASDRDRIAAAILVLADSWQQTQRQQAWHSLDVLGHNNNSSGLAALNFTAAQEVMLLSGDSTLDRSTPIDLEQLAQRLDNHPLAKVADHLRAAELRIALRPSQREAAIDSITKQYANSDTEGLTTLCLWLLKQQEPARVLAILPLQKATRSKALSVTRIETLSALGRWSELENELDNPGSDLKVEEITAELYLARCAAKLDKKAALQNRWDRAFDLAAGDSSKLLLVGGEAEHDGYPGRAERAYRAAIKAQPQDRRGYDSLLRLVAKTSSQSAYDTLAAMAKQWPNDSNIINSKIYAGLLSSQLTPEKARTEAEQLVRQAPADSSYRATYALALLKLGQSKAALEAFGDVAEDLKAGRARVSTAAVHAAVLSANGQNTEARNEAARISLASLAREERALIAPLLPPDA